MRDFQVGDSVVYIGPRMEIFEKTGTLIAIQAPGYDYPDIKTNAIGYVIEINKKGYWTLPSNLVLETLYNPNG